MDKKEGKVIFVYLSMLFMLFISVNGYAQFTVNTDNMEQTGETSIMDNLDSYSSTLTNDPVLSNTEIASLEDGYHFGVWVNYQQQFGALGDKLLTVGGPSFGFNLGNYFFIGGGVYSTFGNVELNTTKNHSFVYGGGIVGFRWNPKSRVVFRTQVLVGAIGFDVISQDVPGLIENRTTSVIVVPEIGLDIRLVGYLFLSLSVNYRYVSELPTEWEDMQGLGALSGAVSLGLSF